MRQVHCGYPVQLTKNDWNTRLDKMIVAFDLVANKFDYMYNWSDEQHEKVNEGLDIFRENL